MDDLLSCPDVTDRLPLFVGGDLESDAETRVTEHIARCSACAELLERASQARRVLVGALQESYLVGNSRSELWSGIRARLVEEGLLGGAADPRPGQSDQAGEITPALPVGAEPDRSWGRSPWLSIGLVAAAACLLLILNPFRDSSPGSSPGSGPGSNWVSNPSSAPLVPIGFDGTSPQTTYELPAARATGAAEPTFAGGLRRVGVEDGRLADQAVPQGTRRLLRPGFQRSTESLAGYR